MKLLAILMFFMPFAMAAQAQNPHQQAMNKFTKFYNAGQGDSINAMFGHGWDDIKSSQPLWTNAKAAELLEEFGMLESFKFVGVDTSDPNEVYVFQTVFSKKGANATSLTLDKDNSLDTFRFITTSNGITRLLENSRKRQ
ncbi:MAG: hypothetical protein ABWZ25_17080 [Chitinophagaceae bacterium]